MGRASGAGGDLVNPADERPARTSRRNKPGRTISTKLSLMRQVLPAKVGIRDDVADGCGPFTDSAGQMLSALSLLIDRDPEPNLTFGHMLFGVSDR